MADRKRTRPWVAPPEGGYIPRDPTPEELAEERADYAAREYPDPPPGRGSATKAWWAMTGARPADRPDGPTPEKSP